ncbi:hypothetical protein K9N68_22725 [Kovacikia minuta CCNUW1]|uniref:hypothetical protein n=1 Tax=Kovacikia minuta TaxID=2931930 RepID=UPI001CCD249D|nr:hypothetical protein [Kovacikia minuta]UBF24486.1 hypothetical protein K9N68_22725 [Kovacikia minuta CCNUW1]
MASQINRTELKVNLNNGVPFTMKRIIGSGLSLLVLSTLTVPGAMAETKIERQLQLTHPAQQANPSIAKSPVNLADQGKVAIRDGQMGEQNAITQEQTPKLSERDRIIREYQTQTIIRDR